LVPMIRTGSIRIGTQERKNAPSLLGKTGRKDAREFQRPFISL
jgi:hypothetical protein